MLVLPLIVGDRTVGVNAARVLAVLPEQRVRALSGAHALIAGVVAWRGRAVAVVDLATLFSERIVSREGSQPQRLVIVQAGRSTLAIVATSVLDLVTAGEPSLTPDASELSSASGRVVSADADVASAGPVHFVLLDMNAVADAIIAGSAFRKSDLEEAL